MDKLLRIEQAMLRIFVCSPYAAICTNDLSRSVADNVNIAKRICRYISLSGHIPIAPHLYFPNFLTESLPDERLIGIKSGIDLIGSCHMFWQVGDYISSGMQLELEALDNVIKEKIALIDFLIIQDNISKSQVEQLIAQFEGKQKNVES